MPHRGATPETEQRAIEGVPASGHRAKSSSSSTASTNTPLSPSKSAASLLRTAATRPSLITIASAAGAAASPRLSANLSLWERLHAEGAVESARMRELWAKECAARDEIGFVESGSARPWCDRPNAAKGRALIKEREPTAFCLAGFAMTNVDVGTAPADSKAITSTRAPAKRPSQLSKSPRTPAQPMVGLLAAPRGGVAAASTTPVATPPVSPRAVITATASPPGVSRSGGDGPRRSAPVRRASSFERDQQSATTTASQSRTSLRRNRSFESLPTSKPNGGSPPDGDGAAGEDTEAGGSGGGRPTASGPRFMRRTASFEIASAKSGQIREQLKLQAEDMLPPPPPGTDGSYRNGIGARNAANAPPGDSIGGVGLIEEGAALLREQPLRFTRWRGQTCGWSLINPTTSGGSATVVGSPNAHRALQGSTLAHGRLSLPVTDRGHPVEARGSKGHVDASGNAEQADTGAGREQEDPLGLHAAAARFVTEHYPTTEAELVETNLAKMATAMASSMLEKSAVLT